MTLTPFRTPRVPGLITAYDSLSLSTPRNTASGYLTRESFHGRLSALTPPARLMAANRALAAGPAPLASGAAPATLAALAGGPAPLASGAAPATLAALAGGPGWK